jgi:hypothetical protein
MIALAPAGVRERARPDTTNLRPRSLRENTFMDSPSNGDSSFTPWIYGIFHKEVHARAAATGTITRSRFWSDLYVPRPNEMPRFNTFLTSEDLLLCVSGPVGCGKTCFVLDKLERLRSCSGI